MLKTLMLLAMVVGAFCAFASPATASASPNLSWETGSTPLGSTTPGHKVTFTGTLSFTKSLLKISCRVLASVDLWNDPTLGAHGEVTSMSLTADPLGTEGCTVAAVLGGGYVDIANCHVEATTSELPWTVTTGEFVFHHVTMDGARFTNKFKGAGCATIGIPNNTEVSESGNATGVAALGGRCIVFNNAGTFTGGGTIDGELCAVGDLRLTTVEEE